jgi:hypothetical protein
MCCAISLVAGKVSLFGTRLDISHEFNEIARGTDPAGFTLFGSFVRAQACACDAGRISNIQGLIVQVARIGAFADPRFIAAVVPAARDWEAAVYVLLAAAACDTVPRKLALRI